MSTPVERTRTISTPRSRRALLAGALGGIGGWAASAIGRASHASASDGDTITVGSSLGASTSTGLSAENPSDTFTVFSASSGSGVALKGSSTEGNSTGVMGVSGPQNPYPKANTGVYGYANQGAASRGVVGLSRGGHGVHGESDFGTGVLGKADRLGYAIRGRGRVKFEMVSGVATIPSGATSVTVTPEVRFTSDSFVLLTPKDQLFGRDLWFTTQVWDGTFKIRISSPRSNPARIAWLLLG